MNASNIDMRTAFCNQLIDLSENDSRIVWLDADLIASSGMNRLQQRFPDRVIDCGIQEANMVGVAGGLSAEGMIPFVHSFSPFSTRRAADQIFVSGIYARQNIRIVGSDPGISACANGGTHISLEDFGILRSFPGTVVLDPCDDVQLAQVVRQTVERKGIFYIRLARKNKTRFYTPGTKFTIGRASLVRDGSDFTILTEGAVCMTEAVRAAELLERNGVHTRILDLFTIKPLDRDAVRKAAEETGAVLTLENHNIYNGLGSAVAEVLAESRCGAAFHRMGAPDCVGEVGTVDYLLQKFGMTAEHVAAAALELLKMKGK